MPADYTLDDWMLMVDWVVQKYLPNGVISSEAEYLAVRSVIAGRVQSNMDRMKSDAGDMVAVGAVLGNAGRAVEISALQQHIIDFARVRGGSATSSAIGDTRGTASGYSD